MSENEKDQNKQNEDRDKMEILWEEPIFCDVRGEYKDGRLTAAMDDKEIMNLLYHHNNDLFAEVLNFSVKYIAEQTSLMPVPKEELDDWLDGVVINGNDPYTFSLFDPESALSDAVDESD